MSTRFLDHLTAAIRIRTVSNDDDPAASHEALIAMRQFLAEAYPHTWASLSPEIVSGHSLLLDWPGTNPELAPAILVAHLDVVPVEEGVVDRWTHPPFSGARTESHLIGRGAIDDKGSLIAILEAVEGLLENDFTPRRRILLAFGHDEEIGGVAGAAAIASTLKRRGIVAVLVLDEGGFITERILPGTRRPVALVGISEKGTADIEISASGQPGHSSAPPKETAIVALARAIARLSERPMPARVEVQTEFFRAASRAAAPGARRVLRDLPKLGRLAKRLLSSRPTTDALIRSTLVPTIIAGGTKANVIPGTATAHINARILPGDTIDMVLDHVRAGVGDGITVRLVAGWEASPVTNTESGGFVTLAKTIDEVFPDAVVAPWVLVAGTDARHYTSVSDTVVRFAPFRVNEDELTGFHGIDERIRLSDTEPAIRFYRRLIERL